MPSLSASSHSPSQPPPERPKILSSSQTLLALETNLPSGAHYNFLAFYSSVVNGIITEPSLMTIPIDEHMAHRGHAVFDTVGRLCCVCVWWEIMNKISTHSLPTSYIHIHRQILWTGNAMASTSTLIDSFAVLVCECVRVHVYLWVWGRPPLSFSLAHIFIQTHTPLF